MKTRLEWFDNLPQELKGKALANTKALELQSKHKSLKESLLHAFVWSYSPEGFDYWDEIYIKL
jgi:hypothetical protein